MGEMTAEDVRSPDLGTVLAELRPALHRYCARMVGSVVDGEDVVQEALLKALQAGHAAADPTAWLFRIAHNAAIDQIRRRTRKAEVPLDDHIAERPDPAQPPGPARGRRHRVSHLRPPAGAPAQLRHPDGRARPFPR